MNSKNQAEKRNVLLFIKCVWLA